jgi:hypothetical protein
MVTKPAATGHSDSDDFAKQAERERPGFLNDFWTLLRYNKRWWLTPIILFLAFIGFLIVLGGTAAAPLIYTLF